MTDAEAQIVPLQGEHQVGMPSGATRKWNHNVVGGSIVWLTPKWLLAELGPFELDPCAAPSPRPWPTAEIHYEIADGDGLTRPWARPDGTPYRVWLNPPYGAKMGMWLRRLADHGRGTALIFARTDTAAFFDQVWSRASVALFLRGRLTFHRPDGTAGRTDGGAPSVLIGYGEEDADRLAEARLDGHLVPIAPAACFFVAQRAWGAENRLTWRELVMAVFARERQPLTLRQIYALLGRHPRTQEARHWRPKVRQTLNSGGFVRVAPGQYALAL